MQLVDEVILTDDARKDATAEIAQRLGLRTLVHPANRGYGGNQKTCCRAALELLSIERCSDDSVFDKEMLVQAVHWGLLRDPLLASPPARPADPPDRMRTP